MNFTDSSFERMMRQRPGTDSGHPCKHCRHKWECGYEENEVVGVLPVSE